MARLSVFKDGEQINDLLLTEDREYIVGRGEECAVRLEPLQGISRQHLKIFFKDNQWQLEVLSRFGEVYQDGEKTPGQVFLKNEDKFTTTPYEFFFKQEGPPHLAAVPGQGEDFSANHFQTDDEKTIVGSVTLSPYLRAANNQGHTQQIFKLEGQSWLVGRDTSCPVFIDHPKMSRRQFEIRFQDGSYMVRDLGSSNGTMLNGKDLLAQQWASLKSGDAISVVDCYVYFELRDSEYEAKLKEIPQSLLTPAVFSPSRSMASTAETFSPSELSVYQQAPPQSVPIPAPEYHAPVQEKKLNIVRIAIGLLLVGGVIYYFTSTQELSQQVAQTAVKTDSLSPFEKLKPEQQQYVRDSYRLADRLFKEGRYEMARQEIAKVHQLVPFFEESKNLEKLAEVAVQTQVDQKKIEQQEKDRQEMEEKIISITTKCRSLLSKQVSAEQSKKIDECLAPAMVLNPEHHAILDIKARLDQLLTEQIDRKEKLDEYLALVRKHKNLFSKAQEVEKQGNFLETIKAYEVVVSSKLPDPQDLRGQSRSKVASIQQDLAEQQSTQLRLSEEALRKNDYKAAVMVLKKALKINPDNESVKSKINFSLNELKKQMQVLYQEGILEESVGEVDSAKAKWKKIIDSSVPDEEYYKKSMIKLKKYGAMP